MYVEWFLRTRETTTTSRTSNEIERVFWPLKSQSARARTKHLLRACTITTAERACFVRMRSSTIRPRNFTLHERSAMAPRLPNALYTTHIVNTYTGTNAPPQPLHMYSVCIFLCWMCIQSSRFFQFCARKRRYVNAAAMRTIHHSSKYVYEYVCAILSIKTRLTSCARAIVCDVCWRANNVYTRRQIHMYMYMNMTQGGLCKWCTIEYSKGALSITISLSRIRFEDSSVIPNIHTRIVFCFFFISSIYRIHLKIVDSSPKSITIIAK